MSSNLRAYPRPNKAEIEFSTATKYILAKKFWDVSGSLTAEPIVIDFFNDKEKVAYLEGIADAGREDVSKEIQQLLHLMESYGTVVLEIA